MTEPMIEPTEPQEGEVEQEGRGDRRDQRTRERLREIEAERDRLAERVTAYQRREYERLAATVVPASALQLMPDEVPLTEDGEVDSDAVIERAAELRDTLREATGSHPHADLGVKSRPAGKPAPSWGSMIMGKSR
jgi:hypothetical protein